MASSDILLVDANRTVRRIVERTLSAEGHRVRGFATAAEAMRAAEEDKPGLVLVDVGSARGEAASLEGHGLRRAFARSEALRDVPFVAMVARAADAPGKDAEPGAWLDSLRKPFPPEALLAVLARADRMIDATEPEEALTGRLEHVALADVLQLLAGQQHTGTLEVRTEGLTVAIGLSRGLVDLAVGGGQGVTGVRLGRLLVEDGACSREALGEALTTQASHRAESSRHGEPETWLGALLVERGAISREALARALARQTTDLVATALRAPRGTFRFVRLHARREAAGARLGLSVPPLLLEGLRRLDEWRLLEARVAAREVVLARDDAGVRSLGELPLSDVERSLLALLDARSSLRDLEARISDAGAIVPAALRLLALRLARVALDD